MKRIFAILKGRLEDIKLKNKVKRVEAALNAAEINAESEAIKADDDMQNALESLVEEDVDVTEVVEQLRDALQYKRNIKEALEDIKEIRDYLNKDVKPDAE